MSTVTPEVGMGATMCYPQDCYPYVVIAVGPNAKTLKVLRLRTDGLKPSGQCNGFPVFDEDVPTDRIEGGTLPAIAYLRKDGRYYVKGTRLSVGRARYSRNWAD